MGELFLILGVVCVVGGIIYLMFNNKKDTNSTVDRAQNLAQTKYDPNMTRFKARKEAKASQARGANLTHVVEESSLLTRAIDAQAQAIHSDLKKADTGHTYQIEKEQKLAQHESYLAVAENTTIVHNMASSLGLDPGTMKELVLERARMETQLSLEYRQMELEVEKHRRMKEIDFSFERQMADLDTKMADMVNLLPQHQVNLLNTQLSAIHQEYEYVKSLPPGELRDREVARVEKKIAYFEGEIDERTQGLS